MLFKLAARNLLRNRKRTVITLIGIIITMGVLVITQGLMSGIGEQSKRNIIDYQTSHFRVSLAGYDDDPEGQPLDYLWFDSAQPRKKLAKVHGVEAVTSRLVFKIRLSDGINELPALGVGIEVAGTDDKVFRLRNTLIAGRYLEPGEEGVLIGDSLAKLFELEVGNSLTVLARTRYDALEAYDLAVSGIIRSGNPRIDKNMVFLTLPLAQSLVEARGGINEIAVRLNESAAADLESAEQEMKAALRPFGINAEVHSWRYLAADFVKMFEFESKSTIMLLGLIVMMAAVSIANTMVMTTFERTKEIGTMMALGMNRQLIMGVFLIEGALQGAIGSLLGCLWGGGLARYYEIHGINMTPLYGDIDMPYPVKDYMYTRVTGEGLLLALLFGIFVTLLASYLPASRASRLNPASALRSN